MLSLDEFFNPLKSTTDACRFEALRLALRKHLNAPVVFRVNDGTAQVQIYIISKSADGGWSGIHAVSVET